VANLVGALISLANTTHTFDKTPGSTQLRQNVVNGVCSIQALSLVLSTTTIHPMKGMSATVYLVVTFLTLLAHMGLNTQRSVLARWVSVQSQVSRAIPASFAIKMM
jgi:hypothetical protein